MLPSEVRKRILKQHDGLRWLCHRVEFAACQVLAGERDDLDLLGPAGHELNERLLDHLAYEERFLVPVLLEADAWGRERVDKLEAEHLRQREELAAVLGSGAPGDAMRRARLVIALVEDLRTDMLHEEAEALSPTVLRDDVVSIDYAGA